MIHGVAVTAVLFALSLTCAQSACVVDEGSCLDKGKLYSNGDIFSREGQSQCFKYKCNNGNVAVHSAECSMNGNCYAVGATAQVGCTTYKCEATTTGTSTSYGMAIEEFKCSIGGNCYAVDVPFTTGGCATYKCTKDGDVYKQVVIGRQCADASGDCRDPGERFPYGGYNNCTCSVDSEFTVNYSCSIQQ